MIYSSSFYMTIKWCKENFKNVTTDSSLNIYYIKNYYEKIGPFIMYSKDIFCLSDLCT